MKSMMIAVILGAATFASHAEAGEQPSVLKGVARKQVLTTRQMQKVRGEGLCGCGPLLTAAACANIKVDVNVHAKVEVPCLLDVNANACVHADVHAFALVKL